MIERIFVVDKERKGTEEGFEVVVKVTFPLARLVPRAVSSRHVPLLTYATSSPQDFFSLHLYVHSIVGKQIWQRKRKSQCIRWQVSYSPPNFHLSIPHLALYKQPYSSYLPRRS
jgi:hypothetical protein